MRKILLSILSVFLFAAPVFAQPDIPGTNLDLEKKCTSITQAMAQKLHLNEHEYIKLKALNLERIVKLEALQSSDAEKETKLQELEIAYEQQLATFLTPKQLEAYANHKNAAFTTGFVASKDKK